MRRGLIAIWLGLIIILSSVVIVIEIAPRVEAPRIIYVDDVPGGGPSNPLENYTSIQDGINAASDGDTVYVYSGFYNELITVNKTINLTGENRDNTIIDGWGEGDIVRVTADWVNISGFRLFHSTSMGSYRCLVITSENNTVTDNIIAHGFKGIHLISSSNNYIGNNYIITNLEGIFLISSSNNNIVNNTIDDNFNGITIQSSSNNAITNNNLTRNGELGTDGVGIELFSSFNITITNNNLYNDGIFIQGSQLSHYNSHNIPFNNFVNGKPLYYHKDRTNLNIDSIPVGQLILVNCTNVEVRDIHINETDFGMEVVYCSDILIADSNISSNSRSGIWFEWSSNSTITGNDLNSNACESTYEDIALTRSSNNTIMDNTLSSSPCGIYVELSSNNIISNNVVSMTTIWCIIIDESSNNIVKYNHVFNNKVGITLIETATNNTVTGNDVTNNEFGVFVVLSASKTTITNNKILSNKNDGILIWESSDNNVLGNNISGNDYGLRIGLSSNNKIKGNIVSNNNYGIYLESASDNNITKNDILNNFYGLNLTSSSNNRINHNNIIDNVIQAVDWGTNQWDDGYPSGGNHWSDFDEPSEGAYDDYRGPNQDVENSDGIVDKGLIGGPGKNPYVIDSDSQDNYPLMFSKYMYLYEGWNLISLPLIQSDTRLNSVLSSIDGSYDAVRWYDASNTLDPWKQNHTAKPQSLNDLDTLDYTMGFWIHIIEPGWVIFEYSGALPTTSQGIQLHPGWNLVGYPSQTSYNRTDGLNNTEFGTHINVIYWYDASTRTWHNMGNKDRFERGRGYWVHAREEIVWQVPL